MDIWLGTTHQEQEAQWPCQAEMVEILYFCRKTEVNTARRNEVADADEKSKNGVGDHQTIRPDVSLFTEAQVSVFDHSFHL